MERLPYIDEHRRRIAAPPEATWSALQRVVAGYLTPSLPQPVVRAWGLQPAAGFAIADEVAPQRLVLRGRHRFSRYELAFELERDGGGTVLRAITHAVFPQLHGRAYRALVISTRLHVLATRRVLRQVEQACSG